MKYFRGKAVIITGSSNGIGRATAKMAAGLGAKVSITGRDEASLKETKRLCLEAGAEEGDIVEVIGDIENEETPKRIVEATVEKFGRVDVLVNNAGMLTNGPPLNESLETFDKVMAVNLRSVIQLSHLATPYLERTCGAIVNVSSAGSLPFTNTRVTFYCISKAALDSLTVQQAGNLIKKGIRVNSVNPGAVETDILHKQGISEEKAKEMYKLCGENTDAIPVGRCAQPEEIAKASIYFECLILFLADPDQSSFIIGQRIVIDGGSSLQNCMTSTAKKF